MDGPAPYVQWGFILVSVPNLGLIAVSVVLCGRFLTSMHFGSVHMFFMSMGLPLWGQFWGAGCRAGSARTWMAGVVIFPVSVVTPFTAYLVQQHFDSQWIALNAKDAVHG